MAHTETPIDFPISIRYIKKDDMEEVMDAERTWNMVEGQDDKLHPWSKSAKDILEMLKQNKNRQEGVPETRFYVCETMLSIFDAQENSTYAVPWVCGAFLVELMPDGYEIPWFTLSTAHDIKQTVSKMLDHMKLKVQKSDTRVYFHIYVRDRDEAHLRELVPIMQNNGLVMRLCKEWYENGDDAWRFTFQMDKSELNVDDFGEVDGTIE